MASLAPPCSPHTACERWAIAHSSLSPILITLIAPIALIALIALRPASHCTSTIPESAAVKRGKPTTRRALERDGRKHDGLLRIDDYGPHGPAVQEWKTAVGSYISETKPTWVDAHGREMARRVGGVDVYTEAGGALRDKSDCRFRKTATGYDRTSGIKRLSCTVK